ncbi:uncharacterized protein G2W53_034956 [Senna tora]|uniref:Uncharacterized protein n=1 Tax=Senna tora TaxID=362788 RepID=A0A834SS10_9FABA|nr:uncharacterized protein G2W53_034956 [Senna tora]
MFDDDTTRFSLLLNKPIGIGASLSLNHRI